MDAAESRPLERHAARRPPAPGRGQPGAGADRASTSAHGATPAAAPGWPHLVQRTWARSRVCSACAFPRSNRAAWTRDLAGGRRCRCPAVAPPPAYPAAVGQHAGVLRAMGRTYDRGRVRGGVRPGADALSRVVNLTTDAIVGFPGEDEGAFRAHDGGGGGGWRMGEGARVSVLRRGPARRPRACSARTVSPDESGAIAARRLRDLSDRMGSARRHGARGIARHGADGEATRGRHAHRDSETDYSADSCWPTDRRFGPGDMVPVDVAGMSGRPPRGTAAAVSDCLFCRIVAGRDPRRRWSRRDDRFLAFRDIAPKAPVHLLVIPERHVASIAGVAGSTTDERAAMLPFIADVARERGPRGGRLPGDHQPRRRRAPERPPPALARHGRRPGYPRRM